MFVEDIIISKSIINELHIYKLMANLYLYLIL